jgi:hypothetical protein
VIHRRRAASPFSLGAIAAVVLVASLVAGVAHAFEQRARPLPIREQQASIVRAARDEHRHIVFHAAESLHGPRARRSEVFVLRDDRIPHLSSGDAATGGRGRMIVPRSDELRIYDIAHGRLREAFRFLPQGALHVPYLQENDHPAFHLVVDQPADIDGDGRPEVVAALERVTRATGPPTLPMLVAWDATGRQYRLSPLNVQPAKVRPSSTGSRAEPEATTKPTVTVDRDGTRRSSGGSIDAYSIVRSHPYAVLLGGYPDGDALLAGRERYELEVWTQHLQDGSIKSVACFRSALAMPGHDVDALIRWFGGRTQPGCEP